jgi:hypothetical protein
MNTLSTIKRLYQAVLGRVDSTAPPPPRLPPPAKLPSFEDPFDPDHDTDPPSARFADTDPPPGPR